MGLKIEIELSDANEIESLTGAETFPGETGSGRPVKISMEQVLEFIKSSPIQSFRMITSGPAADEVLITLSDDHAFQFTKI